MPQLDAEGMPKSLTAKNRIQCPQMHTGRAEFVNRGLVSSAGFLVRGLGSFEICRARRDLLGMLFRLLRDPFFFGESRANHGSGFFVSRCSFLLKNRVDLRFDIHVVFSFWLHAAERSAWYSA